MSKTIAVLASVAALTFANGAWAGSNGSFFYNGHGHGHGHGSDHDDDDDHDGVCERIHNDFLRHLCQKVKNHDHEHPTSP